MSHLDSVTKINYTTPTNTFLFPHTTWLEIDAMAFAHNIAQYKSVIGSAVFAPVIKSNAYGHGINVIAQLCENNPHVSYLCVASLTEAIQIRLQGIKKSILVLSILDADLEYVAQYDITVVVYDNATALALNGLGRRHNKKINIHVKIDTGLSRVGFLYSATLDHIIFLQALSFITIEGIFTHLASSESADPTFTNLQLQRFEHVVEKLKDYGLDIPLIHASCSAASTAHASSHYTFVRAGIGIYGLWPSQANKAITQEKHPHFILKPVLQWKTRIIHLKEIPSGSTIGYDQTYRTTKITKIATLPVGYWDGFDRKFSNNGTVVIHHQQAFIVGRVAMNLSMVDVTHIDAQVGDEVTILGNAEGVRAHDLAQRCSTINYEITTRINPLLPRVIT